jgi:hypothetical protein
MPTGLWHAAGYIVAFLLGAYLVGKLPALNIIGKVAP